MLKIAVNGAQGRMGTRILELARSSGGFKIMGAFDKANPPDTASLEGTDVLIDFSSPEGTALALEAVVKNRAALVVGTTGLGPLEMSSIREASKKIAVLVSPNMSVGANFLFELAHLAASKLKSGYDIEIIEAHHRMKKDAPSGTARKIAEVIARAKGWALGKAARYGRDPKSQPRSKGELGIHVIRAGDIVGLHTVLFSGPGETIELTHRAQSRDAFARGALLAAQFVARKKKGLYSMEDVLR